MKTTAPTVRQIALCGEGTADDDAECERGERELFALAGIGACIHWLEELAALIAGPVLTFGLGIAIIDLLTNGKLLASTPALGFVWAASMAVGLDAQLVGSAAKLGASMRRRAVWPMLGYALLVIALGYVAFQASNVFATQQAEGITTAQALARLGMDSARWIIERSALAVVLVILSGLLRYAAPAPVAASLADERAKLERELELEPLRQRLRAQQVGGFRALAVTALQGAGVVQSAQAIKDTSASIEASSGLPAALPDGQQTPSAGGADTSHVAATPEDAPSDDRPPTGPGSPALASKGTAQAAATNVTPMRRAGMGKRPRTDRRTASRANALSGRRGRAEQRVREAFASKPSIGFVELGDGGAGESEHGQQVAGSHPRRARSCGGSRAGGTVGLLASGKLTSLLPARQYLVSVSHNVSDTLGLIGHQLSLSRSKCSHQLTRWRHSTAIDDGKHIRT